MGLPFLPPDYPMNTISKFLTVALATGFACDAAAQRRERVYDQEDMQHRKEELLSEPWLQKANWVMSFAEAKAKARETGRMIFGYFTRSYAP